MLNQYLQDKKILFGKVVLKTLADIHNVAQFRSFARRRHTTVKHFVDLLRALKVVAERSEYSVLADTLRQNVADEEGVVADGGCDSDLAHSTWREWYLQGIGINLGKIDLAEADQYNVFMRSAIAREDVAYMLGILLFLEVSIPTEFSFILPKLREFFPDRNSKTEKYLIDHIEHDASFHYPDLLVAVPTALDTNRILEGVDDVYNEKKSFYESLRI